jgi:hypothetical protein
MAHFSLQQDSLQTSQKESGKVDLPDARLRKGVAIGGRAEMIRAAIRHL